MVGTHNNYASISWVKNRLSEISSRTLQSSLERLILSAEQKNMATTVLNTPEQLKKLGVQFTVVK